MILDIHAHVGKPIYAYRASEYTNDDLAAQMKQSAVAKSCVFSFYDVQDNEYVGKACRGRDDLIPFAFIDPKNPDAKAKLEHLFGTEKFKGLKLHPFAHGFHLNQFKVVDPMFELCEHYQAPILCHGLADNAYNTVYAFAEMADRFPKVNLVMAHGGFMWSRAEAVRASKTRPNLFIETTCLLPQGIADGVDDIGA
jgi:predicted TIM-barrel fold metal-dependent hydrolase